MNWLIAVAVTIMVATGVIHKPTIQINPLGGVVVTQPNTKK